MIFDYSDQKNYVSIWVGNSDCYEQIDDYLSTVYLDEDNEEDNIKLAGLFLPSNKDRACEEELKEIFCYDYYNQFEYDFGLSYDEDFREAHVAEKKTNDVETLFSGFSYSHSFVEEMKAKLGSNLPMAYNTVVALYDFKYTGGIFKASHNNLELQFLGYFVYQDTCY